MSISGAAKLAGVIGWPVGHSLSPRLHGYWLDRHGIDGAYVPLPVQPEDLKAVLAALPKMGFAGVNVTIPHKEHARRLVDALEPAAQAINAVNTIVIGADGRLLGRNTDGIGFFNHLCQATGRSDWRGARALLLGAGGAARAVTWALRQAGAAVTVANRGAARAQALAADLGANAVDWRQREAALADCDLLINSTSLGMTGQPPLAIDIALLPATAVVYDLVYHPLQTPLLRAARDRGCQAVDGLGMLIHQAAPAFAAWFGVTPAVDDAVRAHVLAALQP